jgi:hypothetical protein
LLKPSSKRLAFGRLRLVLGRVRQSTWPATMKVIFKNKKEQQMKKAAKAKKKVSKKLPKAKKAKAAYKK